MLEQDLERLGFAQNEAKVYLGLLKAGSVRASVLVKNLGMHRNIIYDNLEKLIDKGLVSFVKEGNIHIYTAKTPTTLLDYIAAKKQEIDEQQELAEDVIDELDEIQAEAFEQEAQVFRGKRGLKRVLSQALEQEEILVLGVTNQAVEALGEVYWKNFDAKIRDREIRERILVNADFDYSFEFSTLPLVEVRRLPQQLSAITETFLFGDSVAIFIYSHQPIAFVLTDKKFYAAYKKHFEFLWSLSNAH